MEKEKAPVKEQEEWYFAQTDLFEFFKKITKIILSDPYPYIPELSKKIERGKLARFVIFIDDESIFGIGASLTEKDESELRSIANEYKSTVKSDHCEN